MQLHWEKNRIQNWLLSYKWSQWGKHRYIICIQAMLFSVCVFFSPNLAIWKASLISVKYLEQSIGKYFVYIKTYDKFWYHWICIFRLQIMPKSFEHNNAVPINAEWPISGTIFLNGWHYNVNLKAIQIIQRLCFCFIKCKCKVNETCLPSGLSMFLQACKTTDSVFLL